MFDTHDVSTVRMKQFKQAFGFAQGEQWFGFVVCDENEDADRIQSGIFEGELVLISKRSLPRRSVRVNSETQEITVHDANLDGTNLSITVSYMVRVQIEMCTTDAAPHHRGSSHCAC